MSSAKSVLFSSLRKMSLTVSIRALRSCVSCIIPMSMSLWSPPSFPLNPTIELFWPAFWIGPEDDFTLVNSFKAAYNAESERELVLRRMKEFREGLGIEYNRSISPYFK